METFKGEQVACGHNVYKKQLGRHLLVKNSFIARKVAMQAIHMLWRY